MDRLPDPIPRHTVRFCVAVRNKASGFYSNHHVGSDWFKVIGENASSRKACSSMFTGYQRNNRTTMARNAFRSSDAFANRADVVANHSNDACRINKRRLRMMAVDQLQQRTFQLFFTAIDDVELLHVGGKTIAVQLRATRLRTANVPGVRRAARRAVDEVQGVGDGVEDDARAAEDARPLAHRPGEALLFAGHRERLRAFLVDLRFAGLEDVDHG